MTDGHGAFESFVSDVERHTGRLFGRRKDVVFLLESAEKRKMGQVLMDAAFQAKFIVRTRDVLSRVGPGGEGYDALSVQFAEAIEKATALLRTLVKEADHPAREPFVDRYLSLKQGAMEELMSLFADLTLLKNWEVDGRPVPLTGYVTARRKSSASDEQRSDHKLLVRSIRLAIALLILLLFIDGPFTILGWITGGLVVALLIVIHLEASRITSGTKERPK